MLCINDQFNRLEKSTYRELYKKHLINKPSYRRFIHRYYTSFIPVRTTPEIINMMIGENI